MEQLIARAARDLVNAKYAIALTGAGISTESGISDFRGPSGIWTQNPEAERRAYLGYQRFLADPKGWWEERTAGQSVLRNLEGVTPNPGHYALTELEKLGILRCVITQNVDALHEKAGSQTLLEYHGNFRKLRCVTCGARFGREEFDLEKLRQENQLPPHCPECQGVVKPDSVSFGEPIPEDVAYRSLEEAWKCDVMLICGTSAVVYPFANLPRIARQKTTGRARQHRTGLDPMAKTPPVTIIEINAEPTPLTNDRISDYLIRGQTGEILPNIVAQVKKIRNQTVGGGIS